MKSRQLLLGVILGLLAAVHSTPLSTVSDIPAQPEKDVFAEAMTEGFLINEKTSPSPTTQSFQTNTTSQAPLLSDFVTEGSGEISSCQWLDGSGEDPTGTSAVPTQGSSLTTESGERPETPQTTLLPHLEFSEGSGATPSSEGTDGSGDDPIGTSAVPTQDLTPPTELHKTTQFMLEGSVTTPSSLFDSTTETTAESIGSVLSEDSSSDPSNIQTTHSGSTPLPLLKRRNFSNVGSENSNAPLHVTTPETANAVGPEKALPLSGRSRPDWLIIFGFGFGIMALIGLCVAVATRDKWNKKSSSSSDKNENLLNQKTEQEMQTFLTKNEPKENGQNGEYTVIPLGDIPETYWSD
ncbi:hypothetical protein OJAV_G00019590 [Oryzias javanicus]|uniref:Uncharacterized protein n=1 Tax=Oryzias javanicus TaxID=123683 RepID=A0A437DGL4_ORYJA|nr:hypothetical protein OJAV_G00019590 [Oryzias javanicus]